MSVWEGTAEELHLLAVYVHFLRLGDMCSSLQRDPWQCRAGASSAIWIFIYFFLKARKFIFFPLCLLCAHFLFNTDTKFTFLAPRTLSAPHSKVCKVNFVFLDHILSIALLQAQCFSLASAFAKITSSVVIAST